MTEKRKGLSLYCINFSSTEIFAMRNRLMLNWTTLESRTMIKDSIGREPETHLHWVTHMRMVRTQSGLCDSTVSFPSCDTFSKGAPFYYEIDCRRVLAKEIYKNLKKGSHTGFESLLRYTNCTSFYLFGIIVDFQ